MKLSTDVLAQAGYHAYGRSTGWKNYQGLDMPAWDALGDGIQNAWRAAAVEIVSLVETSTRPGTRTAHGSAD